MLKFKLSDQVEEKFKSIQSILKDRAVTISLTELAKEVLQKTDNQVLDDIVEEKTPEDFWIFEALKSSDPEVLKLREKLILCSKKLKTSKKG